MADEPTGGHSDIFTKRTVVKDMGWFVFSLYSDCPGKIRVEKAS